jgi:hypothetical protein
MAGERVQFRAGTWVATPPDVTLLAMAASGCPSLKGAPLLPTP